MGLWFAIITTLVFFTVGRNWLMDLSNPLKFGLEPVEIVLLILTLLVSTVNFAAERTNVLKGAVDLIIFISYIILIFD